MTSLCNHTTSLCNGYGAFKKATCKCFINKDVYYRFRFSCSPKFANKVFIYLGNWLHRKISARRQGRLYANENTALAVFIMVTGD